MDVNQLFQVTLAPPTPWRVALVSLAETKERFPGTNESRRPSILVHLDYEPGTRFPCPTCHAPSPVHDRKLRSWLHVPVIGRSTLIEAKAPRIKCPSDGIQTVNIPWARQRARVTKSFEAWIYLLQHCYGLEIKEIKRWVNYHQASLNILNRFNRDLRQLYIRPSCPWADSQRFWSLQAADELRFQLGRRKD
jgi:hypothetical protein